jgi:hypothetical protein
MLEIKLTQRETTIIKLCLEEAGYWRKSVIEKCQSYKNMTEDMKYVIQKSKRLMRQYKSLYSKIEEQEAK